MEQLAGSYTRSSDGAKFTYEVQYSPSQWEAKVRDENGDLAGSPRLGVHGQTYTGEALRSDVREWIERSIEDRVGVR